MAEYIEKAELIKKLCFETAEWYFSPTIITIKEFPAADVQPVKHGEWGHGWGHGKCTNCEKSLEDLFEGDFYYDCEELHFCPNCGARMDAGKEKGGDLE